MNGVIVSRQADVGYMATPGAPLLTIESGTDYRRSRRTKSQINRIHLRDQVRVQIDALGQQELVGTVVEIVPAADPASRTYLVKISLSSRRQSARSSVPAFTEKPASPLARRKPSRFLKKLSSSAANLPACTWWTNQVSRVRLVKTGKTYDDRLEVLSGLKEGEQIVVDGVAALSDGDRVREGCRVCQPRRNSRCKIHERRTWSRRKAGAGLHQLETDSACHCRFDLLGVGAVLMLPREEEPQIVVPMIDVFVRMRRIAKEVEERVTKPMENALEGSRGRVHLFDFSPRLFDGSGPLLRRTE